MSEARDRAEARLDKICVELKKAGGSKIMCSAVRCAFWDGYTMGVGSIADSARKELDAAMELMAEAVPAI